MNDNMLKTEEFDIIIAGGGTAACVVAARLAESDRNLSILVIEGGKDNFGLDDVRYPAMYLNHLAPGSKSSSVYVSKETEALNGRGPNVQTGGILGGGSSINFMFYSRALLQDYDSWKMDGWSGHEMKPMLKKLETYHGNGEDEDHGFDGPVHVSSGTFRSSRLEDDFILNACERSLRYISPDGIRQDTAHCYLHPLLRDGEHQNLHLLTESRVIRVLIDNNRKAVGVECIKNPDFQLKISEVPQKRILRARKLVIVSCGALGTPSVLERSGLGSYDVLEKASVPVVFELPGVGRNYQDHHAALLPYYTNLNPQETQDRYRTGHVNLKDAIAEKDPQLGWNAFDIALKTRPTEAEVCSLGPQFKDLWDRDFKDRPSKPIMLAAVSACFPGSSSNLATGQYATMIQYEAYPYSRGFIHITGPEISDKVNFQAGFLTDPDEFDLKAHVWFYKKSREIMRRTSFYRGEVEIHHPKFSSDSKVACTKYFTPIEPIDGVKDLEYSEEDDMAIEDFFRENVVTAWHSLGTAKMAPLKSGGVVDGNLNVYGISSLKVIDMSIVPENVGANTNNTAIAIGEKGAEIIINELRSCLKSG
ncbi:hypothetical protein BY996DRAFT_6433510 [Phakopsora pachyrhizi]|nr:hypothetical protein BY996DRAFT_6433510 [Phakopsora pachyrhizi]